MAKIPKSRVSKSYIPPPKSLANLKPALPGEPSRNPSGLSKSQRQHYEEAETLLYEAAPKAVRMLLSRIENDTHEPANVTAALGLLSKVFGDKLKAEINDDSDTRDKCERDLAEVRRMREEFTSKNGVSS